MLTLHGVATGGVTLTLGSGPPPPGLHLLNAPEDARVEPLYPQLVLLVLRLARVLRQLMELAHVRRDSAKLFTHFKENISYISFLATCGGRDVRTSDQTDPRTTCAARHAIASSCS